MIRWTHWRSHKGAKGDAAGSYAGVSEQAGIHAGDGGFNIKVTGNTDLKGALIGSDADASKNTLTTGSLSFSDIQNQSHYDASSSGFSAGATTGDGGTNYSTHGSTSGKNAGGAAPMLGQDDSGSDSATTKSGVSAGTVAITDSANQKQDVASLNRDTTDTNGTVAKLPDMQNLLSNQADMMAAASAAGEAVSRRIGDYADKMMKDAAANGDKAGVDAWKEGGANRALMQGAGAALVTGLAGGNAVGGAAGAAIASIASGKLNELSSAIAGSDPTGNANMNQALGNIVANALATGAGAAVGGESGAFSGYNVDRFNRQLHPEEKRWINEKETAYAKKYGLTLEQAHNELTTQANFQVQNGSSGTWSQRAHDFLSQAHGMLPADGSSGPGYMFYATPEQKANVEMYAKYYPNGVGVNVPNGQAIASSAGRDQAYQDLYAKLTLGAAAGAAGIAVGGPIAALPGAPIFSSGGALGSGAMASPVGTGAISAGINVGAQYYKDGKMNLVDVAGAFGMGIAGSYGGLLWNVGVNTIGGATTTALNNLLQGKNDSVVGAGVSSGVLSILGYGIGKLGESGLNSAIRPAISNGQNWVATGVWSNSGWNFLNPNNLPVIFGAGVGGLGQEVSNKAYDAIKMNGLSSK